MNQEQPINLDVHKSADPEVISPKKVVETGTDPNQEERKVGLPGTGENEDNLGERQNIIAGLGGG